MDERATLSRLGGRAAVTGREFDEAGGFDAERRTARATGLWYLALALAGLLGFLILRPLIYVADDPVSTLGNLTEQPGLARLGLLFELTLVLTQALAAVWFYRLFRTINASAAWALAAFGVVNAVAVMASAMFLATAVTVAGSSALAPGGDIAATVQLMYEMSGNAWGVGSLFFGLWLIPMGYIATTSGRMPTWLGRVLIVGGVGYVFSVYLGYGADDVPSWLVDGLVFPATIGEIWMICYLLVVGIRRPPSPEAPAL